MTPQMKNPGGQAGANAITSIKSSDNYTTYGIESQFLQEMQAFGINYTGELLPDGKLHRFHIEGHKRGSKNGAYILHLDGCPAGWFMDYKTGVNQKWRKNGSVGRIPRQMLAEIEKAKREREAEQLQKYEAAAKKAIYIWSQSKPITQQSNHQYLGKR